MRAFFNEEIKFIKRAVVAPKKNKNEDNNQKKERKNKKMDNLSK